MFPTTLSRSGDDYTTSWSFNVSTVANFESFEVGLSVAEGGKLFFLVDQLCLVKFTVVGEKGHCYTESGEGCRRLISVRHCMD